MISLISSLSFPVTSMINEESGTTPSNSRFSFTTQIGEFVFVINGRISSSTVSPALNELHALLRTRWSDLLFSLVSASHSTAPLLLTDYWNRLPEERSDSVRILRISTSGPSFFKRATMGLSTITEGSCYNLASIYILHKSFYISVGRFGQDFFRCTDLYNFSILHDSNPVTQFNRFTQVSE